MVLLDAAIAILCLLAVRTLSKEPDCGSNGLLMGLAIMGFLGAVVEGCCRLGIIR